MYWLVEAVCETKEGGNEGGGEGVANVCHVFFNVWSFDLSAVGGGTEQCVPLGAIAVAHRFVFCSCERRLGNVLSSRCGLKPCKGTGGGWRYRSGTTFFLAAGC